MIPIPVIPVLVCVLGGGAYFKNRSKKIGVMTPERQKVFNAALAGGMQDPKNLDKLAREFRAVGLPEQAKLLEKRAELKRLPNEVKLARRQVWRRAIQSTNKPAMVKLANAYEREGCTSAAMRLHEIIAGLPDQIPEAATQNPAPAGEDDVPPEEQTE